MKKNNKPLVSVIILNFNGQQMTVDCLRSLSKQNYSNLEIIVVDNASTDKSVETIRKKFPKVKVILNGRNFGFAQGNNVGCKKARGELILFLNNDALVEKNFLRPLVEKITSEDFVGAVQPKILCYSKKDIIDSVGSYFLKSGFLYHYGHNKRDQKKYNKESEIFTMKGACMLFKKEVLNKVGVFDKDYFAYFEETDLCQRTWIAGYKIFYVPKSKIFHIGGQTARKLESSFVQYNSYKNRIYTYLKNFEIAYLIKVLPLHIFFCEIISFIYLITFEFSLFWTVQRALFWNLIKIPKIMEDRKFIKKIRKVHDNAFLPLVTKEVRLSYYYHLFATALAGYKD